MYSRDEVAKHASRDNGGRVWVTYKDGVYDITGGWALLVGGRHRYCYGWLALLLQV